MPPTRTTRSGARATAPLLALADMPTLTALYERGDLAALGPAATPAFAAHARLNARVALVSHDITRLGVDGIVNAANTSLLGGSGVDGAVHRAAGPRLLEACLPLRGCETGGAKMTDGFDLPARKIIHTVGPIHFKPERVRGEHEAMLRSCYRKSLEVGEKAGLKSIAFCPIGTGIYSYPHGAAAEVAISEVRKFFQEGRGGCYNLVVFTNIDEEDQVAYEALLP
jgi:O-acetyl-ADP-ribose deacetylase